MARKRRKNKKRTRYVILVMICAIITIYIQGKEGGINQGATSATWGNCKLEIPAPLPDRPEKILHRTGYTVSYNSTTKIPNWVAWELTPSRLTGKASRTNKFLPDPDLPKEQAVTTSDYTRSGFDRGHMCPAADNKWMLKAMIESFYMTNICPQNPSLNRGDWAKLEETCRDWARKEGKIYIVCGPILRDTERKKIGKHEVTVPDAFFKVVLVTGKHPKAIGFIFQNQSGTKLLSLYANSVDEVERVTGIDFFPSLPDNVENKIEATYYAKDWGW